MNFPESSLKQPPAVLDLREGDWTKLFRNVREKVRASDPQIDQHPLNQIVNVLTRLGCSDAVIEYPYHDQDLTYDYLHDYGEAFNDCGKDAARMHFFRTKEPLRYDTLERQLQQFRARAENASSYLGFMVVRPTHEACVGRTILRFPSPDHGTIEHVHVRGRYHTNLYGVDLAVFGAPFMHQDQSSHVCAGIALWSLCYDLHRRYRTPRLFPRQVTQIATAASPLRGGGHGLAPQEMARVLREVGCTVDLTRAELGGKPKQERRRLLRFFTNVAYGYLESGAPALLGYRFKGMPVGHVVLLVGHDLATEHVTPPDAFKDKVERRRMFESDYVTKFIVQDDRRGPYQTIGIWNKPNEGASVNEAEGDPRILEDAEYLYLMPGLTSAARLHYHDVADLIKTAFERFATGPHAFDPWYLASLHGGRARERLYLQPARRFKEMLTDKHVGRIGLPERHVKAYLELCLPRHIYVCDFCAPSRPDPTRWCAHGEMLFDATAARYNHKNARLAIRVENCLQVLGEKEVIIADDYSLDSPPLAPMYDEPEVRPDDQG
ncbi:MAG: hypothetical protein V1790_02740 [Planctomycetota bacterium]